MLVFLLKAKARYTVETYLEHWAPQLRPQISVRTYESLGATGRLSPGTYIFCDQERWSNREHQLGCDLWEQLATAGPSHVLLNNPAQVRLRFELLTTLHHRGTNSFNVRQPWAALLHTRYPAFIHSTNNHEGALSPLVTNRLQLLRWLIRRVRPRRWGRLLVEEFCDVSRHGRFAKYAAFNFRGAIVPRHVLHGRAWCLQDTELYDEELIREFDFYMAKNPDQGELAEIFQFARIDYGRMDYALKDGRIQVWEINTNPMIIGFPNTMLDEEAEQTRRFQEMVQPHLLRLSSLHAGGSDVSYRLSGEFR